MRGVLDRFEDGDVAVIIAEEAGREFHVPLRYLPEGSEKGIWFKLVLEQGRVVHIEMEAQETEAHSKKADQLMERLRNKKSGSRFKKKSK